MQFKVGHSNIHESMDVLRTTVRLSKELKRGEVFLQLISFRGHRQLFLLKHSTSSANFGALSSGLSLSKFSQKAFILNVQSLLTVVPALIRLESFP